MMKRIARGALDVAMVGLAVIVALSLVPVWPCALLEHFRVQYLLGGLALTVVAAVVRSARVDVAAIATLVVALHVVPALRPPRAVPSGTTVRVLLLNVYTASTTYADVRALIDELAPDVVGLVEVNQRWLDALAPSLERYRGRIAWPRDDNFGLALFATDALVAGAEVPTAQPTIAARAQIGAARFDVFLVHPLPPISGAALAAQYVSFERLAAAVPRTGRAVVMGDFNATPWSRPFHALQRATGLCDSRAGFGLGGSFPSSSSLLRIPIDHVLVSCDLGVRARWIERHVGSDHLPVVVELVVP